ncbi:unnamed protein product [Clonostachys chloroleuca]|uniref:BHLH domain-containing protein n=1 Tax=Clonostachys chloroleuca TaxID=1926264 RepID=A0AA35MGQ6_9HYPO|nr:unnamed protein product [Clonostachys chloroleuca]
MASDKSPSDPYLPFGCKSEPPRTLSASHQLARLLTTFGGAVREGQPDRPRPLTCFLYLDAIDPNQEPQDPPEPPPGDPLLTDSDSKFLSSFFEDMTADQYNMPSFGEGLNFSDSWLDLPPQFMGTATSFGPQFGTSLASTNGQGIAGETIDFRSAPEANLMPPPPLPHGHHQNQPHQSIQQQQQQQPQQQPQPQQHNTQHHLQQHPQRHAQQHQYHSDDVLNAAATLLQNGAGSRSASGNHEYNFPRRPVAPPASHLRHQPMDEFPTDGRRSVPQSQEAEYGDWMYGAQQQGRIPPAPAPQNDRANDFQWGSDANFSPVQGYTPRLNKGPTTIDSMHREQMKILESLEVSKSAASTRPSSPTNTHQGQKASGQAQTLSKVKEDPEAPPRKRRKSKNAREGTELAEGEDTPTPTPGATASSATKPRRRKPKAERSASDNSPPPSATSVTAPVFGEGPSSDAGSSGGGASQRRKPSANGSKAPRENLSEEQKRENHIRSEQKRRTLIKEGFDDLCELVPGLRGGGFSKSTMLTIAAEWLEELLQGNEALANQLATIERG